MKDVKEGQRYEKLTILGFSHSERRKRYWKCVCDCGSAKVLRTEQLGKIKSCGCLRGVNHGASRKGSADYRLYMTWGGINARCYNTNTANYADYGGRGIVNKFESFKSFRDWSRSNGYNENLSIDRINNDGPYHPDNCRWTDAYTQMRNTRLCRLTPEQVAQLKKDRKNGITLKSLAHRYNMSIGGIAHIIKGRSWADVDAAL